MRRALVRLALAVAAASPCADAQRYAGALQARSAEPREAGTVEASAPAKPRVVPVGYAVLPLRNLSADVDGVVELQRGLRAGLAERGAVFVADGALDEVLRARRVRYTDSLSVADSRAVREATGASFALAGTVLEYARGKEPRIALCVRVIDLASGERVQSAFVTLRGQDFRGLLGLGAIEDVRELDRIAIERVLDAFGEHGGPMVRRSVADGAKARFALSVAPDEGADSGAKVRPAPLPAEGAAAPNPAAPAAAAQDAGGAESPPPTPEAPPAVRCAPALGEPVGRLALLPFVNRSTRTDAGTSFSELLAHAWFQTTGAQVVETSELRSALVRARIRSLNEMDAKTLASIGAALDARWFALGSVDRFGEDAAVRDQRYPEIEVTVRIVDARTGLVATSRSLRVRGDDGETVLRLGVERDPLALAADAARELVLALEGGS